MRTCVQGNRAQLTWAALGRSLLAAALFLCLVPTTSAHHAASGAAPVGAAPVIELVMVADPGCPYCARWEEEVGVAYAASAEGHFAPLVRRQRDDPEVKRLGNIIYSPTFILLRDGVEIGRIVGYPGPDFFWGLLEKLLKQAGFNPDSGAS